MSKELYDRGFNAGFAAGKAWKEADYMDKLEAENKALRDRLVESVRLVGYVREERRAAEESLKMFQQQAKGRIEENKALKKAEQVLRDRWDALKDIFQLTIDHYEDDEDIDLYFARTVLKDMDRLEEKSTFDSQD